MRTVATLKAPERLLWEDYVNQFWPWRPLEIDARLNDSKKVEPLRAYRGGPAFSRREREVGRG